jgi:hypothetical protein
VKLVSELLGHQIDFDHIDADTLTSFCTLEDGGLKNASGQLYRAIIVPTSTVIQKSVLERLRAFAARGGKVVFVGRTPATIVDRTFLQPLEGAPDLSFATVVPAAEITPQVVAALPKPDVALDAACLAVKYIHRTLADADVYFFFNESAETQSRTATIAGKGDVQVWDASDGTIHPLAGVGRAAGSVVMPLTLASHEARFVVIGSLPRAAGAAFLDLRRARSLAELDGEWSVKIGEKELTSALKPWSELGVEATAGAAAQYEKKFDLPPAGAAGPRVYLELGDVREIAAVRLNGTELKPQGWPPYRWDVTSAVKAGANTLVVEVQPAQIGRGGRGGGGGGAGGAGTGSARGSAGGAGGAGGGRGATPAAGGGGGRGETQPQTAGLLGPVRLVTS